MAYDESHDRRKLPDATLDMLGLKTTTPISDRLSFPDITPAGFELSCIRVVADIAHPDRSHLLVEVRLPGTTNWTVVYRNGKPGRDPHLSVDLAWSQPDWAWLRITDVEPGSSGERAYWRAEGHYRALPPP